MTVLQPFTFDGVTVRIADDEQGRPSFVVTDVAALLGYRDASAAARMLRDHQKGYTVLSTLGGPQRMISCTEAGLNRLVLRSNSGNAERVQDWVTDEVLPAIRRTGSYAAPAAPVQLPTTRELAAMVIAEADRADAAERRAAELAPAAAAAAALMSAAGDYSLRDAAHVLSRDHGIDTGQNRLLAHLRDIGWVDRRGLPYQEQIGNGRLSVRTRTYDHPHTGEPMISNQLRVTAKGLTWLHAHWPATATASVTKLAVAR